MRDIKIIINDDGYASSYEKFIGIQNENEATRLVFDLPDIYKKDGSYQYVAFTLPDGTIKVRRLVDYACIIDSEITSQRGVILISIIIKSVPNVLDIETGFIMSSQPISGYIKKTILEETGTNSIDKNVRIYLDEFDALLMEIRATDKRLASILDSDPSKYAEVIDARGGYTVLKNRLDAMLSSINDNRTEIENNHNDIVTNSNNIVANHNDIVSNYSSLLTKINSVASGSPLVASSISGMTDTSRVYVNTTDGYWYYYNGTNWIRGGVYQSTELETDKLLAERNGVADAKEVGYRLSNKKTLITDYVMGYRNTGDLNVTYSNKYISSANVLEFNNKPVYFNINEGYKIVIVYYDDNKNYIGGTGWLTSREVKIQPISKYYTIQVSTTNNIVMNLSDIENIEGYYIDRNIEIDNACIDNKGYIYKNLKNRLEYLDNDNIIKPTFIYGLINYDGTLNNEYRNLKLYMRTSKSFNLYNKLIKVSLPSNYKINLIYFDNDDNPLSKESGYLYDGDYAFMTYPKFKISLKREDNTDIDIDDSLDVVITIIDNCELKWEHGYYDSGNKIPSDLRLRTTNIPLIFGEYDTICLNANDGYYLSVLAFDYNGNYLPSVDSGWVTDYIVKPSDKLLYLQLRKKDNTAITLSEKDNLKISYFKDNEAETNKSIDFTTVRGFSHRCRSSLDDPENTLEAIENSFYKGLKFMETDVRKSSDGVFVLCHDNTINRTSNGTGNVSDYTFDQLREFDFGYSYGWKLPKYADKKVNIPTLEEYIQLCKKFNLILTLDMVLYKEYRSSSYIRDVYNLVKKYNMIKNTVWHLADMHGIKVLLGIDHKAICIYGIDRIPVNYSALLEVKSKANIVGFTTQCTHYLDSDANKDINIDTLKRLNEDGLIAFAYTVNRNDLTANPTLVDDLISYGFIGIGTDTLYVEPTARIMNGGV